MYVDAAYSYRVSSVVCLSVTIVSPANMTEPIQIPFRLQARVGSGNHILDGVQIPRGKGQFLGGKWAACCKV